MTHYEYWADDNLKQLSYTNATIATPTVNYTYDPIYNRVATMADGTGTSSYAYHPVVVAPSPPQLGATQLASVDGSFANDTVTYSYDELGRVLNRAINAVSSSQSYDELGRTKNVTNALGSFDYLYVGATNRLSTVAPPYDGGTTYTYYDNLNDRRLKQITNNGGDGSWLHSSFLYTYEAEDQIQSITRQLPGQSIYKFTHDTADQMAIWIENGVKKGFYIYDLAGNRTQEKIGTAVTNFVYNNVNQLTSRTGAQGDATFNYDLNGSLIGDGTRTFEWNGANRLVAVNIGTHRSEFSYDGIGRRTRIVEKDNSVVTSEHTYLWCGGEICEERDATGAIVQKRFFEQGEQVNGVTFHYTRDHLGSVRELLDYRGILLTKYDYDPWGRQTKLSGTQDAAFGYAGYFGHQPSGLLLTWYRQYDVNQARWISRDPIEEEGGINLYAYVGNDPVNASDPWGLQRRSLPQGAKTKCDPSDECPTLQDKIANGTREVARRGRRLLKHRKRGTANATHEAMLDIRTKELLDCLKLFQAKCTTCPPPPAPVGDPTRQTKEERRLLDEAETRMRVVYASAGVVLILSGVGILIGGGGAAAGGLVFAVP